MNYVPPPNQPPYGAPPYVPPRRSSTNATVSLVMGIIGLLFCPFLCSGLAIYFASQAKQEIARDPTVDGAQMGKIGNLLGIIGLVVYGLLAVFFIIAIAAGASDSSGY